MVTTLQRGLLVLACFCLAVLVGAPVPGCKGDPSWKHEPAREMLTLEEQLGLPPKPATSGVLVQTATVVPPKLAPGFTAADVEKAISDMWAQVDYEKAKVKAGAALREENARQESKEDFRQTVKRWTGWAMAILVALSVAALIASFVPFTKALVSTGDAAKGFGAVIVLGLVRYALLRWGILAANVAMWVSVGMMVLAAVAFGVPLAISLYRRQLNKVADALQDKGEARTAVAIRAVAAGATSESDKDKATRKQMLSKAGAAVAGRADFAAVAAQIAGQGG